MESPFYIVHIMEEDKILALETENDNLKAQIKRLKQVIDDMIENNAEQILEYFDCCRSIQLFEIHYCG